MAPTLDALLDDGRLARLFSKDARHCALQLWILQIKCEQSIENRIIYGRLLPYNHSNNRWSSSEDDNFQTFSQARVQIIRLTLYIESGSCADLLQLFSAGLTVVEVSRKLNLGLSDQLETKIGTAAFADRGLVYRPVCYLLNRDAHEFHSLLSPHGSAGAFSASITQVGKSALLRVGQDFDISLTEWLVKLLNADTGLDFGGTDSARIGDLELLVFPALDDLERDLLRVSWSDVPCTLVAKFDPVQVPLFSAFQFRLSIANGGQIVYSSIATAERDIEGVFECKFELNNQMYNRVDSTELEIYGFQGNHSGVGMLCCRWRIGYIREVHLQGHVVGNGASPIKFDWLEKTTPPSVSSRVKAALTINRDNLGFNNRVGGNEADPWAPINRDFASLFARLHPPKSEGRFFQRWNQGDHEGRLQFVEWFRALLAKYQQHQVVIFDPYFDAAGLGLMLLSAVPSADYLVFRSLPKQVKASKSLRRKSDKIGQEGINNLLVNCEHSSHLLERIKLRIYGLKEGRLHDRYILIIGPDKLPIAGFNLSNSLQAAAQNQPLLITPIPADVLLRVEQYKSGLMQEAVRQRLETHNPSLRLLFDSTVTSKASRRYEPLQFLEKIQAGDVLSLWTDEPSLRGLCGDLLKAQMEKLELIKDDSLMLSEKVSLRNFLDHQWNDLSDFSLEWEVLGELLAHSRAEDKHFGKLNSERGILKFFAQFINSSFNRTHDLTNRELAVTDSRFFLMKLETLLHSSYQPHHLCHATKYAAITWSEYFAIKLLWWHAPDVLLNIAEAQMAKLPIEPQPSDVMCLSLLSQMVSEVALSVQFDISDVQRNLLIRSSNGLLQWMGMNSIESLMEMPEEYSAGLQLIASFSYHEQVQALGWLISRARRNSQKADIYNELVKALHETLPAAIPQVDLRCLVDAMRGHMRQLAWAEPWLFQDVIFPLLKSNRANTDDAWDIWFDELTGEFKRRPVMFDRAREGQMTNIAAFLCAYSTPERQYANLKSMQIILKRQQRILQQPLASTSNWTRWDNALEISMWILCFSRWGQYYLRGSGRTSAELDELSLCALKLTMVRPLNEWRLGVGKQGQLAGFLDQAEELLASTEE